MSQELELSILKTLITNKKSALDFVNESDAKLFSPDNWNFANIIISYIKTYKEIPTLRVISEKVQKNEKLLEYIKSTWAKLELIKNNELEFQHDVGKLKKIFSERQVLSIRDKLINFSPGETDLGKTLTDIQKSIKIITAANESRTYDAKSTKEYLPTFVEKFKAKRNNPGVDPGLMTGYSYLDFATNGLRPADMLLIAGESGFGKSLFLNNIAVQVWMQGNTLDMEEYQEGKDIIYFSLEMPYEDCFNRFLSRLSGVPSRHIESPENITKEEFIKIKNALNFIDKYPYQFKIVDIANASSNDIDLILSDCDRDFAAIFVDYLGIMRPNESKEEQDWLKQGQISYELRGIGRKRNKPIFSAVQLNRKSSKDTTAESNIGLSRLARSGTIATHATHILQIASNSDKTVQFEYHIIKNRKGPKGKGTLIKNLACATLIDKPIETDETKFQDYMPECSDDISNDLEELNF